ncbi:restriction endonuclease [Candidatus Pacearchaeota archaeon]|nr:restriction endonuclease [Candidatus Pacearchaeota archaeon]
MKIEVVIKEGSPEIERGNLLENLSTELLSIYDYEIIKQIRITGMELDLLCKFRPNGKEIYVECKAYKDSNHIQSDVITSLAGKRDIEKFKEVWLITTTELGKDAKGLVKKINEDGNSDCYAFYTPDKLINALVSSNKIKSELIINEKILSIIKDKNKSEKDLIFLITPYGNFWVKKYLDGGVPSGVIFFHANTGDLVLEKALLDNLSGLKTSIKDLDFNIIYPLKEQNGEIIPQNISIDNLKLNVNYINKINDIGFKITHPNKEFLSLDDIFIYPFLEKSDEEDSVYISSKEILKDRVKYNKCLIFGDDVSGKTSLAFTLQKQLNNNNVVLYINADEIKSSDESKFENILIKKFEEQYNDNNSYVDFFRDLLKNQKDNITLIIDDYDLINIKKHESQVSFLKSIRENYKNIFIFANKRIEIELITRSEFIEILNKFKIFKLKEFGYNLRDDLIEKWINLDDNDNTPDEELVEKKDRISNVINITVGSSFIPTYPIYILTMLQFVDDASKLKIQGSSYAELYGYLINKALFNVNAKPEELDLLHTYLSNLAFHLFKNRKRSLTVEEIQNFYNKYSQRMDIGKKFDNIHNILIKSKILRIDEDIYQFNHSYSYYFFTAKYLADNINQEDVVIEINNMINKLYTNEFANIIIFLIHHSKDSHIIDSILKQGEKIFNGIEPYTILPEQTIKINGLIQEEIKLSLKDGKPSDYRKKELEEKDKIESKSKKTKNKEVEKEETKAERMDLFENLNLSFKLIEIQGQIMKNYFGSLNGEKKLEILSSVYGLGLRSLNMLLKDFENFQEALLKEISSKIAEKKVYSEEGIMKVINKILFTFNGGIVMTFIKKISDSIASKDLLISIDKIDKKYDNPASQLIDIAVKLNFPDGLDKKIILNLDKLYKDNYLAKTVLKILVIEHLYKFNIKYSDKQSLCNNLSINFIQTRNMLDPSRKK